jgi:hypothetical protein
MQAGNTQASDILAGLKNEYGGDITDADIGLSSKYLTQNSDFGLSDVINDSELAALNSLAGIDPTLGISPVTKRGASAATFNSKGFTDELKGLASTRKADRERKAAEAQAAREAEAKAKLDAAARETQAEQDRWKASSLATNPPPGGIDFFTPFTTTGVNPETGEQVTIATNQPAGQVTAVDDPNDPLRWVFNQ